MFKTTIFERKYPIDSLEEFYLNKLFDYYKKNGSYSILRLEDENNIMVIKYFQLIDNIGGLSSLTEDNYHVGFIDIDDYKLNKLIKNLKRIQKEFKLSTFYILQSSNKSYHAICLDKHSLGFWIDVLRSFDNKNTLQYQRFALNRGRFVLRITEKGDKEKPILINKIIGISKSFKSKAHYNFLKVRYGITDYGIFDSYTKIMIENYQTVVKNG